MCGDPLLMLCRGEGNDFLADAAGLPLARHARRVLGATLERESVALGIAPAGDARRWVRSYLTSSRYMADQGLSPLTSASRGYVTGNTERNSTRTLGFSEAQTPMCVNQDKQRWTTRTRQAGAGDLESAR